MLNVKFFIYLQMADDPRYGTIKILIEAGRIKSIRDIFIYIPKTIVYKDLGMNFNRFDRSITDPSLFRVRELMMLANLFDVDAKPIIDMAYKQVIATNKNKRKRN